MVPGIVLFDQSTASPRGEVTVRIVVGESADGVGKRTRGFGRNNRAAAVTLNEIGPFTFSCVHDRYTAGKRWKNLVQAHRARHRHVLESRERRARHRIELG